MKSNVVKNAGVTLLTQIINLALRFFLQKVFIDTLGVAYLGYNSVFNNILQMLNLADLGIGVAITGFLYKPIANKENNIVNALMSLYRRIYSVMGLLVSVIGIVVLILLPFIIPDAECSDSFLRLLFFINLVGTVSTYFMAYNRTLLIAQQKSYYVNSLDAIINIIFVILQIICLYIFPNYILFLILNVGKNVISNFIVTIYCNKTNTFLRYKPDISLVKIYKPQIFNYVKDVFISKLGAYVFYGTDNIVISIFRGSLLAGFLTNYTIVTTAVQSIVSSIFAAIQANYGNVIVKSEENDKQKEYTDVYMFFNYIVANICLVCCCFLFQPFIQLYIGEKYLLSDSTVVFLSVNLFFSILLLVPSQLFIIFKLYKYDKVIIAISASLNIIISTILINLIGIDGVLIGTLVTSLIYIVSRLYIISKYIFKIRFRKYIIKLLEWVIKSFITIIMIYFITRNIIVNNWIMFIIYAFIIFVAAFIIPIIFSIKNKELKIALEYMRKNKKIQFFK